MASRLITEQQWRGSRAEDEPGLRFVDRTGKRNCCDVTMTRLYIGNIPFSTTDDMLRYIFEHVGPVRHAKVITAPDGRSRGFGFVEMVKHEDAAEAIEWFNGDIYEGRTVTVSEAHSR